MLGRRETYRFVVILVSAVLSALVFAQAAHAEPPDPTPTPPAPYVSGDTQCLMCHSVRNFSARFQNGERISLYVDAPTYYRSIHGTNSLGCNACHADNYKRYPHHVGDQVSCQTCHTDLTGTLKADLKPDLADKATLPYPDRRTYVLKVNEACQRCHAAQAAAASDGVHAKALKAGNPNAPTCTDCHTAHETSKADAPRTRIPQTCAKCHQAIYSSYASSVHGAALINDQNTDVPTCTTCHGVHNITDPLKANFRNASPQLCANCHANKDLMAKYGLSTDVFQTYLTDFHGRTVNFFERTSPNVPTNKATCADCHGVHDIQSTKNASASVVRANLQATCQQCHANASVNFPDAWTSHFLPTWEKHPAIYAVNLFYQIVIPGAIGFFVLYIALDARRRFFKQVRPHREG